MANRNPDLVHVAITFTTINCHDVPSRHGRTTTTTVTTTVGDTTWRARCCAYRGPLVLMICWYK
jgi:hypothetical protein